MKRLLIYTLVTALLLGALPACALAATADSPIILGGSGDESCYSTLVLPNGNLILSMATSGGLNGEAEFDGYTLKTWLVCLAPDGSIVWENVFGSDKKNGYTTLHFLTLNDDNTFYGTVRYEIDQRTQYRQKLTFSCDNGSILAEGEKVMDTAEEDNAYREYFSAGGLTVTAETLSGETGQRSRSLTLTDARSNVLWQLDANAIGLNHIDNWVRTSQGCLMYGRYHDSASGDNDVVALLVDDTGNIVWSYRAAGISDGDLSDGIVDSRGRFVAVGFCRDSVTSSDTATGFRQLVLCLDAATGTELWQKATELTDYSLPHSYVAELDGQYILCGSGDNYNSSIFQSLDQDGNALQYWTVSIPECSMLSPKYIQWNGELWTRTMIDDGDSDVALQRVVIP